MRDSAFMAEGSFAPKVPPIASSGGPDGLPRVLQLPLPPRERGEGAQPSREKSGPHGSGQERLARLLSEFSQRLSSEETLSPSGKYLPLAVPRLDTLLSGGLRRDALHEIRSTLSRDSGAATGFAAAVLARLAAIDTRPILWVVEGASSDEAGALYGAGLGRLGLDPQRLIVVRVRRPIDALWVTEEGLACNGLAAVLTEIRGAPRLLDLTATRRLALRARSGVMGLLLRQVAEAEPSAATTRWLAEPLPATALGDYAAGIGFPAWRLVLERNRRGATGAIDVEWDHARRSFADLTAAGIVTAKPTHPLPVPALPVDRPAAPPETGKIMALPVPFAWKESPREIRRRIAWAR